MTRRITCNALFGLLFGISTAFCQTSSSTALQSKGSIAGSALSIAGTETVAMIIGASSYLQANLGWISFGPYDTAHPASSEFNGPSCPSGASVEGCIQTILGQLRSQGVTGVRVFIPLCDAFPNCGPSSSWNPAGIPTQQTWITNVGNFFQDVATAGIANVTITITSSGPQYSASASSSSSPIGSCSSGNCCGDTGSTILFDPLIPYGMTSADGFAIGDYWKTGTNQGYNCAPVNSQFFIGWTNYFNAINAILGAARSKVNVYGFELSQELSPMAFTATMRYFYDNSSPQTAPSQYVQTIGGVAYVNVVSALRSLMSANGFDPGRVEYSAAWSDATASGANCANAYTDFARNGNLDSITQTINGGPVGVPAGVNVISQSGLRRYDQYALYAYISYLQHPAQHRGRTYLSAGRGNEQHGRDDTTGGCDRLRRRLALPCTSGPAIGCDRDRRNIRGNAQSS